ncbi:hypothetical protein D5S18_02945 [Nocardia panacis]|uniref:Uncharacterized protein n=1 Tax=Nocardia panacis TaxID=2340916 RepID=A0A3A4KZC2_9NOCA|nr:hypothetical protein [Nocardia panacis]RJO79304.1 hypothetical protein D5S18_02945 [Nocardia panacis]
MTTPSGNRPDGAYTIGSRFGADQTEDGTRQQMGLPIKQAWQGAQDTFRKQWRANDDGLASVLNGQAALSNRLDLLRGVSGFASAYLGRNWSVRAGAKVVLPFDTGVGPVKHAGVVKPSGDKSGWLVLKAGGLWRVDTHLTSVGHTTNELIVPIATPPYFIVLISYDPIAPVYWIEVFNGKGDLLTVRQCDALTNVAVYSAQLFTIVSTPFTTTFAHTVVLDDMPPENDPAAPESWAYVRVTMRYDGIASTRGAAVSVAECNLRGGSVMSGLTATRWSKDATNKIYTPSVPDGGKLQ